MLAGEAWQRWCDTWTKNTGVQGIDTIGKGGNTCGQVGTCGKGGNVEHMLQKGDAPSKNPNFPSSSGNGPFTGKCHHCGTTWHTASGRRRDLDSDAGVERRDI